MNTLMRGVVWLLCFDARILVGLMHGVVVVSGREMQREVPRAVAAGIVLAMTTETYQDWMTVRRG